MNYLVKFGTELWTIFLEMSPYLLLGFFFAGLMHLLFPGKKVSKYLGGNNFKSVLNASLIGVPLPLCSCGVIPTGLAFYRHGASRPSTVSFLISTPQTGADSIMVTWSLLGLPFAIIRPV
ncbi:MAG TPA: permease, partial [Bacteroidales bacterium]|nr:permease [Bacteroidales bacterium]